MAMKYHAEQDCPFKFFREIITMHIKTKGGKWKPNTKLDHGLEKAIKIKKKEEGDELSNFDRFIREHPKENKS